MTAPGQATPSQGDVLISSPSPLTGERELYTVVSADIYNAAGGPTVLVAEIETGTRYGRPFGSGGDQPPERPVLFRRRRERISASVVASR